MSVQEVTAKLKIKLPPDSEMPDAEAANFFYFTFVGPDVQLLTGYVDLRVFHEAVQEKDTAKDVVPRVRHRFLIPALGFQQLRDQVNDIGKKYDQMLAAQKEKLKNG